MEMKSQRLEISVADFRQAFEAEPMATFNRIFDKNYEPIAKKIAQGEFFRFWARHGTKYYQSRLFFEQNWIFQVKCKV